MSINRCTRLKSERLRRRLSQDALGMLSSIPQRTLSHIEIGRVIPTPAELDRLARVLDVHPATDLLKDVGGIADDVQPMAQSR